MAEPELSHKETFRRNFYRVCRTYHKLPSEVRKEEFVDYCQMLEGICEVPGIDQAFFYAFCGGGKKEEVADLTTPEGRQEFLKKQKEEGK